MSVLVETQYGTLEGIQNEGLQVFKGIPYAQPPVGKLRFCAPLRPAGWEGVREAKEFSASAIQGTSPVPGVAAEGPLSEDCLYLNVYTPRADDARRPVMFWIHGGGFTLGSAALPLYNGGFLAERGDVVVVTINYRLGALGYLFLGSHGGRDWGASANCGQLDQIAALEWAHDNIAFFGGDPNNVTIFGESAGAVAVVTLMAIPQAKGLFHKVIAQSGAADGVQTPEQAAGLTKAFLADLGVDPENTQKLQEVSAEDILKAQPGEAIDWTKPAQARARLFPVVDGETLPRHPREAVKEGEAKGIPLMAGTNRDEMKLFKDHKNVKPISDEELEQIAQTLRPPGALASAADMVAVYKRSRAAHRLPIDNVDICDAMVSDVRFRIPCTRLAEAHGDAYLYLFTWESPAMRGALGACHALELPFVFGTLHHPMQERFAGTGPEAVRLSDQMMDAWIAFASSGNPNHEGLGSWEPYDTSQRASMLFGKESACTDAPLDEERAAWDLDK
ncbi:MAG: carboxylesterase/lipase family protein [Deltaproteobacteria bacterium]|nr:carboxylesterase/lipase family protein [Deltaproteobacteria bacterium]